MTLVIIFKLINILVLHVTFRNERMNIAKQVYE